MRRSLLFIWLGIAASACAGSGAGDTTVADATTVPVSGVTTTAPPATTTTVGSTTTVESAGSGVPVIVGNDDGAFLVDADFSFQLVEGPVELAVDDGVGGVVFQRTSDRGRREPRATIVYYVPPDSFEPRELLVPTGEQYLKLWEVDAGEVWYSRREGDSPETSSETLRTYDFASRTVDQLAITGGWEAGTMSVSVADSVAVAYWSAEATTGFEYYDSDSAHRIGFGGDPYQNTGFCVDGGEVYDEFSGELLVEGCFEYAALDNSRLAYIERAFDGVQVRYLVVVVDLDGGAELFRRDLERPDQGWVPREIDLLDDHLLVNRTGTGAFDAPYVDAVLFDLTTGTVTEIGVAGQTRFLRGPMGID